ncbi:Nn.00g005940.m01.CDS01 [Neocucurbitaria sp. VM-36]
MSDLIDAERLLALLQQKPTVVDREGAFEIRNVEGYVTFEDVSFADDIRKTTIRNLYFSAQPGQTVALVGATGAGKSTITKLLLRFYDVAGGRIYIDGHDIRDVKLDTLRNLVGVVPQDPLLFNGTILENLRYAKRSATFAEIIEACQAAAIHDKILTFTDGYQTRVREQGVKLSGGEVQRLAVARVILKDPPILILDEATSANDTHTESNIQRALDAFKNRRKRTTFVIAHRLSTIVSADQIFVFDEGKIVERGTHRDLAQREGVYKRLWSKQVGARVEELI